MAEATPNHGTLVSAIRNFLDCSICCGPYDDPRALPCLHPFCHGCLENWAISCSPHGESLSCPLCKKVYSVPENGFPPHFIVANLRETFDSAEQKNHVEDLCSNHDKKNEYFCEDCSCAACSDCAVLDPNHQGHGFIQLKKAAQEWSTSVETLKKVEQEFAVVLQQTQLVKEQLIKVRDSKIKAITDAKYQFLQQVDCMVRGFKQNVYDKVEENMSVIRETEDKLQADLNVIRNSSNLAVKTLESGSDSDIISLIPLLLCSLQEQDQLEPSAAVDSALGDIHLELPLHTKVTLPSLDQMINDKLAGRPTSMTPQEDDQGSEEDTSDIYSADRSSASSADRSSAASSADRSLTSSAPDTLPASSPADSSLELAQFAFLGQHDRGEPLADFTSGSMSEGIRQHGASANSSLAPPENTPVPQKDTTPELKQETRYSGKFGRRLRSGPRRQWKKCGQFKASPHADNPCSIAIHSNGDICLSSSNGGISVFSKKHSFKHVALHTPSGIHDDVAVTLDNQYIILDKNMFLIFDRSPTTLNTILTSDIDGRPSTPSTVTVDSTGRIIVGLGKTVSIHQMDGTLISKFTTSSYLNKIACTPDDWLVVSLNDNTLQVMDQSGRNASIIEPPPDIHSWVPAYTCCSKQGELFVGNHGEDSTGVYRYVASEEGEYEYKDCVTWMEHRDPWGLALSADEEKLYVVDKWSSVVKIFK